jgi:nucleoside-diphosphate-sugar epimerase
MRILITGGNGLIGGRLVRALSSDHDVWSIVRQPASVSGVTEIAGDLSQPVLPDGLPAQADAVIHLAQSRHYRELPDRADDVFAVNVASTARLLEWARKHGVSQFILASSGAVGQPSSASNFYVASRQCAEWLAQTYAPHFTVLVARFFFAYGPEQARSMLIPRLVDSVRTRTPITLTGENGLRINPVHVDDAVRTLVACLRTRAGGMVDVAGNDAVSLRLIAEEIGRLLRVQPQFSIERSMPAQDLIGDPTRMRELGGSHQWSIASGLRDMVGTCDTE